MTEVFYTKWTQMEGFQRTRGVLRTFAVRAHDASQWDQCPLIGPNAFLGESGKAAVSAAARELTGVAASEEYEGKKQDWNSILEGELNKAQEIQAEVAGLAFREVEQAVFATFLHSQPIGHKASQRDLELLLAPTRPDKIQLRTALLKWADASHFLDDEFTAEAKPGPDGKRSDPKSWRLGSKPNLVQMHNDACTKVSDLIEPTLLKGIESLKSLRTVPPGSGLLGQGP